MPENVQTTIREGVAEVVLDRPPVNAMSRSFLDEIIRTFQSVAADDTVKAIVLAGKGRTFSAGVDLKAAISGTVETQDRLLLALNKLFHAVYSCPRPVVAAINGHAIAGGLVLALACDYRIATSERIRASLAEVQVGIPFPVGALEIVRRELQPATARRLALLGQTIDPDDANGEQIFDERVAPERLVQHARSVAEEYSKLPPIAFARIKNQLRSDSLTQMEAALSNEDPLTGNWFAEETLVYSRRILQSARTGK